MSRLPAFALVVACALGPELAMSPALADSGYPPTGPTGGGVTTTLGGGGVSTVPASLPRTGTDVRTPALVGGSSVLVGVALLVGGTTRRRRRAAGQAAES
ncbi:MAG: hypothetical protein WCD35_06205 [Mycobacteriales bacterium]